MKRNMGNTDRIIRLVLVALFLGLFLTNVATGILGIVLLVVGFIVVLTSVISFCPLYALAGISTCPGEKK